MVGDDPVKIAKSFWFCKRLYLIFLGVSAKKVSPVNTAGLFTNEYGNPISGIAGSGYWPGPPSS